MTFNNSGRYSVSKDEGYEPGSNEQVLKNYLGIQSKDIIDQVEARELKRAELEIIGIFDENHQFTSKDICQMHTVWLKDIYPFAGNYRSVNMSKEGFPFAGANYISGCMNTFERDYLAKYTPCHSANLDDLSYALGIVHVEFILIHPFREGNGRIGRLLAILMALQAGRPPLDFSVIDQTVDSEGFKSYILAIHAGHAGNYIPMQKVFKKILETTL